MTDDRILGESAASGDFDPTRRTSWQRIPTAGAASADDDRAVHARAVRRALWGTTEGGPDDGEDETSPLAVADDADTEPVVETTDDADTHRVHRASPLMALVVFVILALVACERREGGIVLWHAYNGAERDALALSAARWNAEHPEQPIELVNVPHAGFGDKLTSAIPGGNGPDLFIYPQDRVGGWVDAGLLEPIEFWLDDARLDRFSPEATRAMGYKGSLWGLPVTTKSLALFYRTDLVDQPPATTDELFALAKKMRKKDGYAIAYANVDLYGHAPWLYGYGGRILDDNGQLAIASTEAADAMAFAKRLVDERAAPEKAEGPTIATLFNEGKTATAVSGPWFTNDLRDDTPWAVATLPTVSATGKPAAPFLGVEGLLMSARAHDKDAAFAVMDFLTSDEAAIERVKVGRQVVPNSAASAEIANDPVLAAFRAQQQHAVPMAMDSAMRMVWTPYRNALGEVLAGRGAPGPQLLAVEHDVQTYLDGPQ